MFSCCPMEQPVLGSCCGCSSLLSVAKVREIAPLLAIFSTCKPLTDCVSRSATGTACPNGSVCEWASCPMVSTTSDGWSGCCTTQFDAKTRGIALLTRSSTACKPVFSASQRSAACLCDPVLRCSGVPALPIHPDVGLDVVEGLPSQKQYVHYF